MNATVAKLFHQKQAESLRIATDQRRTYGTRCAQANIREARIEVAFRDAERAGLVRLDVVEDPYADFDDLCGDMFTAAGWPEASEAKRERARKEYADKVDREGVWGIVGEYFDGEDWQHADSVYGFVGDDWKGSGYDTDIMDAALCAAAAVKVCPTCGRPGRIQ